MACRGYLLVACLVVCRACTLAAGAETGPDAPLAVGTVAPQFSLSTLEGTEIQLSAWRDHVVVVNFFITWYRDAARHLGIMEALSTKYGSQGLRLLSVSLDEGQGGLQATQAFVAANQIAHPVASDPEQKMARSYGVRALPAIFVIGRDGRIRAYHEGYMEGDDQEIESLVIGVLAAGASAPPTTESTDTEQAETEGPVCRCFKPKSQ